MAGQDVVTMCGRARVWVLIVLALAACAADPAAEPAVDASVPVESGAEFALPPGFDRELALAELSDSDPAPDVVEVELEARVATVELAGQKVEAWTYNGVVPGPLLRAREGDRVRVHFRNRLPEATTIHWHGLEVPAAQDGADHHGMIIPPEGAFDYEFVVPHAGTYWYHPHVNSAAQVWRGLYAPLIVEPRAREDYGRELTLVLHDLTLESGKVAAPAAQGDLGRYFGHEGFQVLVNGRELPTLRAYAGATFHLRVINASISRFYRFAVERHMLLRIAGDSGLMERSQNVRDHLLVPGERAEFALTVQGAAGEVLRVRSLAQERFACGGACGEAFELLRIAVDPGRGRSVDASRASAVIEPVDISRARVQTLEFADRTVGDKTYLTLNGRIYGMDPLVLTAAVGDTEVWHLRNRTDYDHPFHLHGFRFQLLDVGGRPPAVREWKDTFDVPARSEARFAVTYDDRPGSWMFHCHIAHHADLGMMGVLELGRSGR